VWADEEPKPLDAGAHIEGLPREPIAAGLGQTELSLAVAIYIAAAFVS
jgi:hypothetical protein